MTIEEKATIITKFFTKERIIDDPHLERLFSMDDEWNKAYQENRIKIGFSAAHILAGEVVVCKVLAFNYI